MAAAEVVGVGHERLLHSSDRTEVVVLGMLIDRVAELRHQQREQEVHMMANEIAKRF